MVTTLMTAKEMKGRLAKGDDAFDLSIEKWKRIKAHLLLGGCLNYCDYTGETCALCEVHNNHCCGYIECGVLPCPLSTEFYCGGEDSPWENFNLEKTPENAQKMIDAIKTAGGELCIKKQEQ